MCRFMLNANFIMIMYLLARSATAQVLVTSPNNNQVRGFTAAGLFTDVFTSTTQAHGVVRNSLGQVYISSYTEGTVRRYLSNGALDTSFGASGVLSGLTHANGLTLDSMNRLYVTGAGGLWRFNSNGTGGEMVISGILDTTSAALDDVGRIYVTTGNSNEVRRYSAPNVLDISFNGSGILPLAQATGLVLDLSQSGFYVSNYQFGTVRHFFTSGALDSSFNNGMGSISGLNYPHGLDIDDSGNLYVTIAESNNVVRFKGDGTDQSIFISAANGGLSRPLHVSARSISISQDNAVPEPGTAALLMAGGLTTVALVLRRYRK